MEIDPGKFNPNGPSNEELDAFFKVVTNLLGTPGVPAKLFGPEKTKAEKAERHKAAKFPKDLKMTFEDNPFDPKSNSNEELDTFFRDRKRNFTVLFRGVRVSGKFRPLHTGITYPRENVTWRKSAVIKRKGMKDWELIEDRTHVAHSGDVPKDTEKCLVFMMPPRDTDSHDVPVAFYAIPNKYFLKVVM